jgi:hypothetical protein
VRDVRRILGPTGIYLVNTIDYYPTRFTRAEIATVASMFRHVAVISYPSVFDGYGGGNILIVASDSDLPNLDALRTRVPQFTLRTGADVAAFAGGADVLRDDFAPVDQLLTHPQA